MSLLYSQYTLKPCSYCTQYVVIVFSIHVEALFLLYTVCRYCILNTRWSLVLIVHSMSLLYSQYILKPCSYCTQYVVIVFSIHLEALFLLYTVCRYCILNTSWSLVLIVHSMSLLYSQYILKPCSYCTQYVIIVFSIHLEALFLLYTVCHYCILNTSWSLVLIVHSM